MWAVPSELRNSSSPVLALTRPPVPGRPMAAVEGKTFHPGLILKPSLTVVGSRLGLLLAVLTEARGMLTPRTPAPAVRGYGAPPQIINDKRIVHPDCPYSCSQYVLPCSFSVSLQFIFTFQFQIHYIRILGAKQWAIHR